MKKSVLEFCFIISYTETYASIAIAQYDKPYKKWSTVW